MLDPEAAEAANFDSIAAGQRLRHRIEHRVDDGF